MKTPAFWNQRGPIAFLLWPFSFMYPSIVVLRRLLIKPVRVGVPVICIGGLTAGGAGKTPVALHIGRLCKKRGVNAFYVSRGYKGSLLGPVQVNPASHKAAEVGDEPLLLSHALPTIVAKNRLEGVRFAAARGATLIITDDGFQNPAFYKDFSFVVVDGKTGFGNGFTLPAGPLREWPASGVKNADAIISINSAAHSFSLPEHKIVLFARTIPDKQTAALKGKKLLAFCGLAIPQKFFATLQEAGADIVESKIFSDHHAYRKKEVEALAHKAKELGALLVTTGKDAVRLPPHLRALVTVADIEVEFAQPESVEKLLNSVIASFNDKKDTTSM